MPPSASDNPPDDIAYREAPHGFTIERLDPLDLLLDPKNPRLVVNASFGSAQQDELLKAMWGFGVQDVATSIATSGYQDVEPLFAERTDDGVVVVEGNRRLTALQVLLNPERAIRLKILGVPTLSADHRPSCEKVSVAIGTRNQVWAFIGTKHLNGPKLWESEAKAHYISVVHEEQGVPLDQIAKTIGDKNSTVKRLYLGMCVLKQAEHEGWYNRKYHTHPSGDFPFSHLYTLIGYSETKEYLEISDPPDFHVPIPLANREKAKQLFRWIFGHSEERILAVVKSQNPDLRNLNKAISKPAGIEALNRGLDVRIASEVAEGADKIVLRYLTEANLSLKEAVGRFMSAYKGAAQAPIEAEVIDLNDQVKLMRTMIRQAENDE
jgi:hypothetical protein